MRLVVRAGKPIAFTLALRIPGWCRGARLSVNGKTAKVEPKKGYAKIKREWKNGDRVELHLPMPVERIEAHPSVRHDCGRVALQRGPMVYCLEEADNSKDLNDIVLPRNSPLRVKFDRTLLGGVPVITAAAKRRDAKSWKGGLYRPAGTRMKPAVLKAIPYFAWANRGAGEMIVWIRSGK